MRAVQVASLALIAVAFAASSVAAQPPVPCTVERDCFGHASSVQGNSQEGCICTCENQWYGAQCQFCPPGVDYTKNCAQCLPGYENYPFCALACTVANNCSNHATNVTGDSQTGCQCTCRNQWVGATCEVCPPGTDASKDCAACLPGYENYPFCSLACTINGNCSGHAVSVTGDSQTGCKCTCQNQWYGGDCQVCPQGVDANDGCGACLPGYDGYPFCAKKCTIAESCNGHAVEVRGNAKTGCQCACTNQWAGGTCDYCPPNFDATSDCSTCAAGYSNYPYCNRNPQKPPRRFARHENGKKPEHF
jgi:hypothetical protein